MRLSPRTWRAYSIAIAIHIMAAAMIWSASKRDPSAHLPSDVAIALCGEQFTLSMKSPYDPAHKIQLTAINDDSVDILLLEERVTRRAKPNDAIPCAGFGREGLRLSRIDSVKKSAIFSRLYCKQIGEP